MESLFVTHLSVDGAATEFAIHFENETYVFHSSDEGVAEIRLKREGEAWVVDGEEGELQKMAIAKLETFLLAQH